MDENRIRKKQADAILYQYGLLEELLIWSAATGWI